MKKRRAVVTGIGVVAPNGIGTKEFWNNTVQGVSGVKKITSFDTARLSSKIAGQVAGFEPARFIPKDILPLTDRFVQLGMASAKMALEDSRLSLAEENRARIGVIFGTNFGGVFFLQSQIKAWHTKGVHRFNPICVPVITLNALSAQIAIMHQLYGPTFVVAASCAAGSFAVGESFRKIVNGEVDVVVSGGSEALIAEMTFGAHDALRVLSKRNDPPEEASCPFDKRRDGFVLGEGAASLVIEEYERACRRGADIYAEIIGFASNSGAYHMVIPKPDGADTIRVMQEALRDAGIRPKEVQYINAHGTSTIQNDKVETFAIKEVFGKRAYEIPVSSTKSMIGHTIGAAGAIEAAVCCLSLKLGVITPTINYRCPDPACDLDYVPQTSRSAQVSVAMSNSFGFGSTNACLVFRRSD